MNQMADDLERLFVGQGQLIQHLRKVNSEDPVTGLASRSSFDQRLKAEIMSEEKSAPGVLAMIRLAGFADYNMAYGREEGDQLLRQVAGSRSEEHTSELQSRPHLVCRLLLEKKNMKLGRVRVVIL